MYKQLLRPYNARHNIYIFAAKDTVAKFLEDTAHVLDFYQLGRKTVLTFTEKELAQWVDSTLWTGPTPSPRPSENVRYRDYSSTRELYSLRTAKESFLTAIAELSKKVGQEVTEVVIAHTSDGCKLN